MTEWPSYIDLQTGEKLLEKTKLNKQLYLISKNSLLNGYVSNIFSKETEFVTIVPSISLL